MAWRLCQRCMSCTKEQVPPAVHPMLPPRFYSEHGAGNLTKVLLSVPLLATKLKI